MKKKTTRDGLVKIDLDHKNIDLKRLHCREDEYLYIDFKRSDKIY